MVKRVYLSQFPELELEISIEAALYIDTKAD